MKPVKRRDLINTIEALGGHFERSGRHEVYKCQGVSLPIPTGRDIAPGTFRDLTKLLAKVGIDLASALEAC